MDRMKAAINYRNGTPEMRERYAFLKNLMTQLINAPRYSTPAILKDLPVLIEAVEFQMQECLNLPKNNNFHSYWNKVYGCKCPILDNEELFGTGQRICNEECPYHGKVVK